MASSVDWLLTSALALKTVQVLYGGALPSRDELKAASERLVNPLGRQKLSREERQQRTAERLAKQPVPTEVYGGGRRAGARAQPV